MKIFFLSYTLHVLSYTMRFLWKIGGQAGFGIVTMGINFSKIAIRSGYHVYDYAEFPSLIRGGHNTYEVLLSDEEVSASQTHVDLLVCLNKDTYDLHKERLSDASIVVYDPEDMESIDKGKGVVVPFKKIARDLKVMALLKNTIALGASLALLGGDIEHLNKLIIEEFGRKGPEVIDFNEKLARIGYDYINEKYRPVVQSVLAQKTGKEKMILTGNDGFSTGAIAADCRLYASYPMTPTSQVLTNLAAVQTLTGMIVRHAEDEIAVVSTALGSSFAGVRSAVATSGGGFALMVESISFAGIAEIPLVIFLGQRPGPATGMPTWTEQGDLLFAAHAGHGEFPKVVLAGGDAFEMLHLTLQAFDLADKYQIPVILMGDKLVCESHQSFFSDQVITLLNNYMADRGKMTEQDEENNYLRYKITEDGISPRLLPGTKGHFYQANSYEHIEDGHTTENSQPRIDQVHKRAKKWATYLQNDFMLPSMYGDIEDGKIIFVSWGSPKGAIKEARKLLEVQGTKTGHIHFTHLYPMNREKVAALFKEGKRYVLVENNSQSQFGKLLMMETGVEIKEKILKYDGRPFYPEEIVKEINLII